MTLQASSSRQTKARRFNPWAHAFWQTMRENSLMTIVSLIVYSCTIVGVLIAEATSRSYDQPFTARFNYMLFDSEQLVILMPAIIVVLSILQGILTFRLLYNKKAVNTWFSIGITRRALFASRFSAGLVGMLLAIILPMTASLIINLSIFRDSGLIISRYIYVLSVMCIQAMVIYSITTVVCVTTGTILESAWHSIVFVSAPSIVFIVLNAMMAKLLLGNDIGVSEQYGYVNFAGIFERLLDFNPLAFTFQSFERFAAEQSDIAYNSYWPIPIGYLPILGWLAVTLGLIWLASRLMVRFKTENAGVRGSGKVTGFISVITVACLAFSTPFFISDYTAGSKTDLLLCGIACLVAGVVFIVLSLVLKLLGKTSGKKWLILPISLAGMLAITGIFYTGCFGYSAYTPNIRDVKSASITYKGDGATMPKQYFFSGDLTSPTQQSSISVDLTKPEDIALALKLHQDLIQAGHLKFNHSDDIRRTVFGSGVRISYTLNSGRVITRVYTKVQMDMLEKMLVLDNTAGVKSLILDYMNGKYSGSGNDGVFTNGLIYISTRFLSRTDLMDIDASGRAKLLDCIISDLESQSIQDRYFPQKAEVCILQFTNSPGFEHSEEASERPYETSNIYVTEKFMKTIAFLKESGYGSYLDIAPQAEEIDLVDYRNMIWQNFEYSCDMVPILHGSVGEKSYIDQVMGDEYFAHMFRDMKRVTDPNQINDILAFCRSQYFCSEGGYVVYIKHKGQDKMTSAFLPMKDAPDFVKQTVK